MAKIKQIGMAAGTFSVALGIGFIMQNGDALANRFGGEAAPEQPAPFTEAAVATETSTTEVEPTEMVEDVAIAPVQGGVLPGPAPEIETPEPILASVVTLPETAKVPPVQEPPVQMANLDPEGLPDVGTTPEDEATTVALEDCVPVMSAEPAAGALVSLTVEAPCHAAASFTVHHQGMMFTATTDQDGNSELSVPALAEVAVLIAAFNNGDGAVATTVVPDFATYDRAVLQWEGDTAVMLSAYEGDANFGDSAHIHAGNPGDATRLDAAEGGYLVRLGDASAPDALMAEIYTFPTGMMDAAPNVMIVAEAEITASNCGQELNAQSIQISTGGDISALDLTLNMPECDAVGDFLILQNMFEDLTLASR